jgi:L-aminopeptidase/D-esterase-like protein
VTATTATNEHHHHPDGDTFAAFVAALTPADLAAMLVGRTLPDALVAMLTFGYESGCRDGFASGVAHACHVAGLDPAEYGADPDGPAPIP